ncbi:MAG: hypothetical protein DSY80_09080 [Desulfocapsa sp.]|nr:MAG: hypothetical protein DSY80_09080 [Desulfocapsa sp.]
MTRLNIATAILAASKKQDDLWPKATSVDLFMAAQKTCKDKKIAGLAVTMVMTGISDFIDWAQDVVADEAH